MRDAEIMSDWKEIITGVILQAGTQKPLRDDVRTIVETVGETACLKKISVLNALENLACAVWETGLYDESNFKEIVGGYIAGVIQVGKILESHHPLFVPTAAQNLIESLQAIDKEFAEKHKNVFWKVVEKEVA